MTGQNGFVRFWVVRQKTVHQLASELIIITSDYELASLHLF
jgi:hypothetical protein